MEEIFKEIPGYEDYKISNFGRVKSFKYGKELDRIIQKDDAGYYYINLCKLGQRKCIKIHSLVSMVFLGHIPNGRNNISIDHIDNDISNNKVDNLQIVTNRFNCSKDRSNYLDGTTGTYYHKQRQRYLARIWYNGKNHYLGSFINRNDASNAYQTKLKEIISQEKTGL